MGSSGLRGGVPTRGAPARAPPTCGCGAPMAAAARCSSAATWAATTGPILPDPSAGSAADVLLLESTYGDRLHPGRRRARTPGGDHRRDAAKHGKLIIPVVRHRPRRGGALRHQAARRRRKSQAVAGLRRQPDGPAGAQVLQAPCRRARQRHLGAARRSVRILYSAFHACRLGPGVEGCRGAGRPGHRHLGQRHGHRRAGVEPPGQGAARCTEYRAVRRIPGGRHSGPPADRRFPRR